MSCLTGISSAADTLQIDSTAIGHIDSVRTIVETRIPTNIPMFSDMITDDTVQFTGALSAEDIFGAHSVVANTFTNVGEITFSLTSNAVFQSLILIFVLAYIILLYRDANYVQSVVRQITTKRASQQLKSEYSSNNNAGRFLITTRLFGAILLSFLAVKCIDIFVITPQLLLSTSTAKLLSIIFAVAVLCVALYNNIVLRIVGSITLTQSFVQQLLHLRLIHFSFWVIITAPAILMFSLCPRDIGWWWLYVVVAEVVVVLLLYVKNSLLLFMSKNISILHWFLYLCAVEIFPISLLGVIIARC